MKASVFRWPKFIFLVNLIELVIPGVNSQLDYFDLAAFLDGSPGPVLNHCLNQADLESSIDLIAIEIPSQFMLSGVEQEFPLKKLNNLNCEFGKSTIVLNTTNDQNRTGIPVSHFTSEEGLLFWNGQYFDPALYCIERFEGSELEISICSVKCSGPVLCFPKCCPFNYIFDTASLECLFLGEMKQQLPSIYQSVDRRLSDEYVTRSLPIHNFVKPVVCELRQSPYILNATEFRLVRNGDLFIQNSTLWQPLPSIYNYCIYDAVPEDDEQDWSHELIIYQCVETRKIDIKSAVRSNAAMDKNNFLEKNQTVLNTPSSCGHPCGTLNLNLFLLISLTIFVLSKNDIRVNS